VQKDLIMWVHNTTGGDEEDEDEGGYSLEDDRDDTETDYTASEEISSDIEEGYIGPRRLGILEIAAEVAIKVAATSL
jgi:hypothetical protein